MPRLQLLALGKRIARQSHIMLQCFSIAVQYKYDICGDHTV